jgi:hypothetical protein
MGFRNARLWDTLKWNLLDPNGTREMNGYITGLSSLNFKTMIMNRKNVSEKNNTRENYVNNVKRL